MKKKFITNLALLLLLNFLVKTFWMYGIDRKIQNMVGAEEYGLYFSLLSLSILLNILLDIGITNFNNREIARDHHLLSQRLSLIIPLKLGLSLVYGIIVFSAGLILGYSTKQFGLLSVLVINQFFLSFVMYLRSNISGLHLFRTDALLSVADRFFVIVICSLLIWGKIAGDEFKIEWLIYSQTAAYILTFFIVLIIVLRKVERLKLGFGIKNGMMILRQSYPFAILILLMSFFNRFDSVLLERILEDGKLQAGIYAQSYRILDSVNMFAVLMAGMLLPIFSRMIKLRESPGEMVKLSFSIVIVPAVTLVAIAWFYNVEIIGLLYHEEIVFSSGVFRVLMTGFIFISTSYIFGTLLTANKSLRALNILAFITVFLSLILNLILIPQMKAVGSAIASVTAQGFFALSQVLITQKILSLKINVPFILKLLLFFAIVVISSWLSHNYISPWGYGFLTVCMVSLAASVFLKILTPRGIYRIVKYDE